MTGTADLAPSVARFAMRGGVFSAMLRPATEIIWWGLARIPPGWGSGIVGRRDGTGWRRGWSGTVLGGKRTTGRAPEVNMLCSFEV